jgi:hypothetical protein
MSAPSITLEHTGYTVKGVATIALWGGGQGSIEMKTSFIPKKELSRTSLMGCINDNGFGCEAIIGARIWVYDNYGYEVDVFRYSIELDEKACRMYHDLFFKGI